MRQLSAEEMVCVSGGRLNQPPGGTTDLPGYDVSGGGGGGIPNDGYYRPSPGDPGAGGGGGSSTPGSSGGLSASAQNGLARIKAELGVDLTSYAQMSPTLALEIGYVTTTYNWQFDYSPAGSSCGFASATSNLTGTIHIGSAYQGQPDNIVQQLSHELGHIDHQVKDDPHTTTAEKYVGDYLESEGYATLMNETVRNQLIKAGYSDIHTATSNLPMNEARYDSQYQKAVQSGQYHDAAVAIGQIYGDGESINGRTYRQIFLDNYHNGGGTQ